MGFWLTKGRGTGRWWAGTGGYWPKVEAGVEESEHAAAAAKAAWLWKKDKSDAI